MRSSSTLRTRLPAVALVIAGIFFVLYPAIRPFSGETTLEDATAFASSAWLLAHSLAMVGFILVMLGLLGLYGLLRDTRAGGVGIVALVVTWIGVGFTLPYYGAETFALHAVGQEAIKLQNADLYVTLTNAIRFGEGIWLFGFGLLALAVGIILFAVAIWKSGILVRWSGIPLAAGFALFIPQFFAPQPVRVGHGLLVMVGCLVLAWSMVTFARGRVTAPR